MRTLSLALTVALLSACTATDKDTGDTSADADTDTDTDADADFDIIEVTGNRANNVASYTITTNREATLVDLDMTETGDSYLYHEYHDGFVLDSINADGSETYLLELNAVTDLDDVSMNSTTLFYSESVIAGTTWLFGAQAADGSTYCIVTGDDVSYYSASNCEVQ